MRHALAGYLALLLAYGLGNAVQDFWLEQIVKRGLTSFELPMVLSPALNWGWAVVLLVAGKRAQPWLQRGGAWIQRRWPVVLACLLLLVGSALTVLGGVGLLTD